MSALAVSVEGGRNQPRGRVLVAEDETLIRLDIRSVLEQRGWEVCGEARDGREAVRLASDLRPDVTLMDVWMPGLDGVEATRLMQLERRAPVVMMTAHDRPSLVVRSILAGARSYVLKPFAEHTLEATLADAADGGGSDGSSWRAMQRPSTSPRHAEIVSEAKQLFATRGYEATSMQDIADAVGLLKGSLYYHIASKQELLRTIVATFLDAAEAVRGHAQGLSEGPGRRLRRFVATRRALTALDPDGAAILVQARHSLQGAELASIVAEAAERDERFLEQLLGEGEAAGAFRLLDEPAALAARSLDVVAAPYRRRPDDFGAIDRDASACAAFVLAAISDRSRSE